MKDTIRMSQMGGSATAYTGRAFAAYLVSDDEQADMYMGEGDTENAAENAATAECKKVDLGGGFIQTTRVING